jgi:putative membrane protein
LIAGGKKEDKGETALDILKKRYAKGEISKEEFEEKKKIIE